MLVMGNSQGRDLPLSSDAQLNQFFLLFDALPSRVQIDWIAALARRFPIFFGLESGLEIADQQQESTRFLELLAEWGVLYDELAELFEQFSDSDKFSCASLLKKRFPFTLVVGAFDAKQVEYGEFKTNPDRPRGCSILPATATDKILQALINGVRASSETD